MQAGALAEFRADWSTAVKTYQTAYSQVQKVPLGTSLPLQHWHELTSVAEQMHIKVGCHPDCKEIGLHLDAHQEQMSSLVCYRKYEAALGSMLPRSVGIAWVSWSWLLACAVLSKCCQCSSR